MSKAEELIACLEGEIAKRDETIVRLEPQLNRAIQANYDLREELAACRVAVENCEMFRARIAELEDLVLSLQCKAIESDDLRAELAAIKAQEPVAEIALSDDGYKIGLLGALRNHRLPIGTKLYAAPVSEAKAQGVVMPPSPYMPGSQPTDFTDYELGEIHGRIAMWEEVKRLNAAPVQQVSDDELLEVACHHGNGNKARRRAEAIAAQARLGSAILNADGYVRAPVEPTEDMVFAGCAALVGSIGGYEAGLVERCYDAMLAAAPAAPAADAGLVEALDYQALFDAIAAATSVYANGAINISVQAFRDALAAHRSKGVA